MRKPQETDADRVWREKVDSTPPLAEAVVLLLLMVAAGLVFIAA
jgi:hypothetical protein